LYLLFYEILSLFQNNLLSLQNKNNEAMEEKILMDLLYQSMQDSAREARLSLGRPSSQATREEALQQVAMLKAAKEANQPIGR
jgi:hypothetical protein